MNDLKECIKDAFDEIMDDYLHSEEYKQERWEINKMFYDLRSELSPDHQRRINDILNACDNSNNSMALEAFYRGVINGIMLRDPILSKKKRN